MDEIADDVREARGLGDHADMTGSIELRVAGARYQ
jgi:hypothetical protein